MMKKILLTFIAAVMVLGLSAQRKVTVIPTVLSPTPNAQVYASTPFTLQVKVVNNGPDTLKKNDTIFLDIVVTNGLQIHDTFNHRYPVPSGINIPPTQAGYWSVGYQIANHVNNHDYSNHGQYSLCVHVAEVRHDSVSGTTINKVKDTSTGASNHTYCQSYTFYNGIHDDAALSNLQVYPNPALTQTTFTYSISSYQHVRLSLCDITGKEVSVPVDENQSEGEHMFIYNTEKLTPGIYIYRLTVGDRSTNGKLIIE